MFSMKQPNKITEDKLITKLTSPMGNAKNFLTDQFFPTELQNLTLEYIEFIDLFKIMQTTHASHPEDKAIQQSLREKFQEKKVEDLNHLLSEIKVDHSQFDAAAVLNIIHESVFDIAVIERAIVHLTLQNPTEANQLYSNYFDYQSDHKVRYNFHPELSLLFFQPGLKFEIQPRVKAMGYTLDRAFHLDEKSRVSCYLDLAKWTPLVTAVLINEEKITEKVVRYYPECIPQIKCNLRILYRKSSKAPDEFFYQADEIKQANAKLPKTEQDDDQFIQALDELRETLENRMFLLLEKPGIPFFSPPHPKFQKVSSIDKYLNKLDEITTFKGLQTFSQQLLSDEKLTMRRSPGFTRSDTHRELAEFNNKTFSKK